MTALGRFLFWLCEPWLTWWDAMDEATRDDEGVL